MYAKNTRSWMTAGSLLKCGGPLQTQLEHFFFLYRLIRLFVLAPRALRELLHALSVLARQRAHTARTNACVPNIFFSLSTETVQRAISLQS